MRKSSSNSVRPNSVEIRSVPPLKLDNDLEEKKQKEPNIFLRVLSELDIHGIASLMKAEQLVHKIIWIILLLMACGVLIFGLVQSILDYIRNPVLTSYDIVAGDALQFPNIYLCPTNYINHTFVTENEVNMTWSQYFLSGTSNNQTSGSGVPEAESLLARKQSFWERISVVPRGAPPAPPLFPFPFTLLPATTTTTTTTTTSPPLIYHSLQEYFLGIGFRAKEFIRECSFQGKITDCSSIVSEYFDKDNGKCFLVDVKSAQTKPGEGLSLVLDLNTRFFRDPTLKLNASLFDGVYVMIRQKFNPAVADRILLNPGEYTRIGLDAQKITRISGNHRGRKKYCRSDAEEFRVMNISEYTMESCQMDCTQEQVLNNCGCILAVDGRFIRDQIKEELQSNTTDGQPNDGYCTGYDVSSCVEKMLENKKEAVQACMKDCYPQCEEWSYIPSLSHMRFPSRLMGLQYDDKYKYEEDYLILDITFLQLQYTNVIQSESMTAATFVSNVGGQMGVWMGASILTIFQLILVLSSSLCRRR